jgi:hypothetical protein
MTQDEILEMARQTGVLAGYEGEPSLLVIFAKAMMDVEREACAKTVETIETYEKIEKACFKFAAKTIRARGEQQSCDKS